MKNHVLHILLVEDNEDDVLLIEESLSIARHPYELHVACDGDDALMYMRREGKYRDAILPGIILLDINMPKKDGFEVLREIKSDPGLQHLPVVILTTSDREADILRSYANGAASFITKPAKFGQMQTVLKQFLLYWSFVSRVPVRGN